MSSHRTRTPSPCPRNVLSNINFAYDETTQIGFKEMKDIYEVKDFWSWMRLGFVPFVMPDEHGYSELLSSQDNYISGGRRRTRRRGGVLWDH